MQSTRGPIDEDFYAAEDFHPEEGFHDDETFYAVENCHAAGSLITVAHADARLADFGIRQP